MKEASETMNVILMMTTVPDTTIAEKLSTEILAARLAACRSRQHGRQDHQADAETGGQDGPARADRCGRDAYAHPLTPAFRTPHSSTFPAQATLRPTAIVDRGPSQTFPPMRIG